MRVNKGAGSKGGGPVVKRDKNGRIVAGSASINGSANRRINNMRNYMDELYGDNSEELIRRLDAISRGETTIQIQRDLTNIRKRQGNNAAQDPASFSSDETITVVPSISEMLTATTVLMQYHLGKPTQQVDMTVDAHETKTIDLKVLPENDLKSYHEVLKKIAVQQGVDVVDAEFAALPPLITANNPTQSENPDAAKNDENA